MRLLLDGEAPAGDGIDVQSVQSLSPFPACVGPLRVASLLFPAGDGTLGVALRRLTQSTSSSNEADTAPFTLNTESGVGIAIALIVAALANSVGIGGGLFWVPLFNALLGFSVKAAAAMSQACVAMGALGGTLYSLTSRHPEDLSHSVIDFGLSNVLMPPLVLGVAIGVVLNAIAPSLILASVLFVLLVLIALRTTFVGIRELRQERAEAEARRRREEASGATLSRSTQSFTSHWAVHRPIIPWTYLIELILQAAVFLGFQIGKAQYSRCDYQWGLLFGVQALILTASSIASVLVRTETSPDTTAHVKEGEPAASLPKLNGSGNSHDAAAAGPPAGTPSEEENGQAVLEGDERKELPPSSAPVITSSAWRPRKLIIIWTIVLCIGILAGMVGLGGGVLLAPLMIELGLHPSAAAATSTMIVLFSSTMASVTFGVLGRLNMSYFAVYGPVCFVGGLIGVFVISGAVKRWRKRAMVTLLLSGLVWVSAGLVAGFGGRESVEDVIDEGGLSTSSFCSD